VNNSAMVRNQRSSSKNRDRNVYLALLRMKQRQGTILVLLSRDNRTRARKKEGTRSHTRSREIR